MVLAIILLCAGATAGYKLLSRVAYPTKYNEYVKIYASRNNLSDELVYAVIRTESSFKPQAVSHDEARGLMQITEVAFDWAKQRMRDETTVYDDLFDPETNIKYGTYILALLTEEFKDTSTVLCAYHAGWGSVKKWLADSNCSSDGITVKVIPYQDTEWYVSRVNQTIKIYKQLYKM